MMQLTATTNSRLAAAINVDPSLISKLKSGVRTVTEKSDYLLPMAEYFGSKCLDSFRSLTLLEILGADFGDDIPSALEKWFIDNERQISYRQTDEYTLRNSKRRLSSKENEKFVSFHSGNAKSEAIEYIKEIISQAGCIKTVKLLSDCGNTHGEDLFSLCSDVLCQLSENGTEIIRITSDFSDLNGTVFDIFSYLPVLCSGNGELYYYNGLKSVGINNSMLIISGVAALISQSADGCGPTAVATDKRLVSDCEKMFNAYLAYCEKGSRSALYSEKEKLRRLSENFSEVNTDCICVSGLFPYEAVSKESVGNCSVTEIVPLLNPNDYSDKYYLSRIKEILYQTEADPRYNAVTAVFGELPEYNIVIKKNSSVLVFPCGSGKACAEITHPASVSALWQYFTLKYIIFNDRESNKELLENSVK